MAAKNVLFVHGWSDVSKSMKGVAEGLKTELRKSGIDMRPWFFGYRSQDDEATLADYAEGLHLWLHEKGLIGEAPPAASSRIKRDLHFVTHSTGALVVRRWMMQYEWARAAEHVATITFLAPANFGSPLAHKGKSFLGHLAKGIREMRDFGETGARTLEALELASPTQWAIADWDLFGAAGTIYGADLVRGSVITGASGYGGLRSFVNEDGTDGTIVVSGAGLSCRKFNVDFASGSAHADWLREKKNKPNLPFLVLAKHTHSSILDLAGDAELARFVAESVQTQPATYDRLCELFAGETSRQNSVLIDEEGPRKIYQQFVVRLVDDRGDSIRDYFIEFGAWRRSRIDAKSAYPRPRDVGGRPPKRDKEEQQVSTDIKKHFGSNVHAHSVDSSYRRFLIDPAYVNARLGDEYVLCLDVVANSGDDDIEYNTAVFSGVLVHDPQKPGKITWIYPDTTTLIEMRVDRFTRRMTVLSTDPGERP